MGFAGYSVTLGSGTTSAQAFAAAAHLPDTSVAPEFLPLTSTAPTLASDPAAQAIGLDRMVIVDTRQFAGQSTQAVMAQLQHIASISGAEPAWLQSGDKRYLACDYKLRDNATDQVLAATARQALLEHGISAATLADAGTMEFVSLRHFNGRQLLQVAFVRRPVGGANVVYVAVLDPSTHAVLALAQANWYLWS